MNIHNNFYQAQLRYSAAMHERMSEMQRKAGREDLAQDSKRVASARRIAANNLSDKFSLQEALQYGEDAVNSIRFIE